jgi:hypothetical protein
MEFQVQGLELDWVCVTWEGDFRFNGSGWNYHDFRGDRWCNIANVDIRDLKSKSRSIVALPCVPSADLTCGAGGGTPR